MEEAYSTLRHAVRWPVIGSYLGRLALVLLLLTIPPTIVAVAVDDQALTRGLGVVLFLLAATGLLLRRLPVPQRIQLNEAMVVAALAFLATALLMALPFHLAGFSPADAVFESVSAVTTTGLTVLRQAEQASAGALFLRAWMQWYGGLGIVVLSVALLLGQYTATRRLSDAFANETTDATARAHAREALAVYTLLTVAGVLLLWALVGDLWSALLHGLSAVSTGGLAPHDASLAALDSWAARLGVMLVAAAGALPLALYARAWRRGGREVLLDVEFRSLWLMILGVTLLLLWFESGRHAQELAPHALLLAISAQTTSGFSSLEIAGLGDAAKLVLIAAMAVGGGAGSTAGGIKLLRVLLLLRLAQVQFRRTALPDHAVLIPRLGGRELHAADIERAALLLLLFLVVVFLSWLTFVAAGYAPLDALFEVVSATGTVGLSTGITDSALPAGLKAVLCLDMLLGRLEIIALLILFLPATWLGKRADY